MNKSASGVLALIAAATLCAVFPAPSGAQVGQQQGLVDPNVAAEKDLLALPHLNAGLVKSNLNTASDENILSIPGLGKRLLHEFKEYRPCKTMEQLRKEIGKYVSSKEIARLERYVTL